MRVTDYDHLPSIQLTALVSNAGTDRLSEIVISNMQQAKEGFWTSRGANDSLTADWSGDCWIPPHRIFCVLKEIVYGGEYCDL